MSLAGQKILEQFSARKLVLPVLFGIGVLVFVFIRKFDEEAFSQINWTWMSVVWLLVAVFMMCVRQFFYMWRIRFLTDYQLSWRASFQVIMLWEFSSAATPSAVGGTAIALFLLAKEDIPAGKSIALVLCTILLDMAFLLVMLLVGILIFDFNSLFPGGAIAKFNKAFFFLTFTMLVAYTLLVLFGLFGQPQALKWLMVKVTAIKWFKKWQHRAEEIGDQLIKASDELQHRSVIFWLKAFGMTAVTWTGRFAVANCLIMIVTNLDEHLLLFVRQVALMVMLMMAPTPGGQRPGRNFFPRLHKRCGSHGINCNCHRFVAHVYLLSLFVFGIDNSAALGEKGF